MTDLEKTVAIIGGGIHGLSSAITLANKGYDVTLLEKKDTLFGGTSGATHNRAHYGYHYPRSLSTATECRNGCKFFLEKYPDTLTFPDKGYYVIAKEGSKTSPEEFKTFCNRLGIPYTLELPGKEFVHHDMVLEGFGVQEPTFNMIQLRDIMEEEARRSGVHILKSAEFLNLQGSSSGPYSLEFFKDKEKQVLPARFVVNATYAYSNNTLDRLGLPEDKVVYDLQTTEVAIVTAPLEVPPLTIMDGPFVSLMPFTGHPGQYLLYDVVNSVVDISRTMYFDDTKVYPSHFTKMVESAKRFFPFAGSLEHCRSLFGSRPIRVNAEDSRETRIKAHRKDGIFSILEGKCISAPLIAQELTSKIREYAA
jgi:hypothetical protein